MSKRIAAVGLPRGRFRLVDSGIEITGTPTLHEWVDAVEAVKGMVRVAPKALAALYAYGKSQPEWAEEFYQVTEGYDRRTVDNWVSLVRNVTPEIMADAPSIGHADVVRSLPIAQQKKMIQAATDEQMTVMELRQRVRNDRKVPRASGHANVDAEGCQKIAKSLSRTVKELAELGFSAEHGAVVDACRCMQQQIIDVVMTLHAAADAAIASNIKAPKGTR